jgi:hypothetical protein
VTLIGAVECRIVDVPVRPPLEIALTGVERWTGGAIA